MPSDKPAIPQPYATVPSLVATAEALKEAVETLNGQREKTKINAAVTWDDLVQLGLIGPEQVPRNGG